MGFFRKLESSAEGAMKVIAYFFLFGGIIATIISAIGLSYTYGYNIETYEFEKTFHPLSFFFLLIAGVIASYIVWASMMFVINIGMNIKKLRKHFVPDDEDVEEYEEYEENEGV